MGGFNSQPFNPGFAQDNLAVTILQTMNEIKQGQAALAQQCAQNAARITSMEVTTPQIQAPHPARGQSAPVRGRSLSSRGRIRREKRSAMRRGAQLAQARVEEPQVANPELQDLGKRTGLSPDAAVARTILQVSTTNIILICQYLLYLFNDRNLLIENIESSAMFRKKIRGLMQMKNV